MKRTSLLQAMLALLAFAAVLPAHAAAATTTGVAKDDSIGVTDVIGGILYLALIIGPGICYLLMRKKRAVEEAQRFTPLPMEGNAEDTPEGEELGRKILNFLSKLRRVDISDQLSEADRQEVEDPNIPIISSREELQEGYSLVHQAAALPQKSTDLIETINLLGNILNSQSERLSTCSKRLLWIGSLGALLWITPPILFLAGGIYSIFTGDIDIAGLFLVLPFFAIWIFFIGVMPFALYKSMQTPVYLTFNKTPGYIRFIDGLIRALGLGGILASIAAATTETITVYKEKYSGRIIKTESDLPVGCFVGLIGIVAVVSFAPFAIAALCIVNFMRNYVHNK